VINIVADGDDEERAITSLSEFIQKEN
jgi:phosphotransferase system HPr-like phosphotransfer protein